VWNSRKVYCTVCTLVSLCVVSFGKETRTKTKPPLLAWEGWESHVVVGSAGDFHFPFTFSLPHLTDC